MLLFEIAISSGVMSLASRALTAAPALSSSWAASTWSWRAA